MRPRSIRCRRLRVSALAAVALAVAPGLRAACSYFAALDKDVSQPGQKAFLTWEPSEKAESFTVQPKFEGDARDFGMVIPTPSRPSLDEMPRDFFKHLAVYTILLPLPKMVWPPIERRYRLMRKSVRGAPPPGAAELEDSALGVTVLEAGVVGSLDYKILEAADSAGLYAWLDRNGYSYSGDEATLGHYIRQRWFFTVMKIDTQQMKRGPGGGFLGEVTPTRFSFRSDELVYPLRITQSSVKDRTEAVFYVQAPTQVDLKGEWSWKHSYRVMWLNSGTVCISQKSMTPAEREELQTRRSDIATWKRRRPGFDTTKLDWAHRLDARDEAMLEDPTAHFGQLGFPDLPPGARVVTFDEFAREVTGEGEPARDPGAASQESGTSEGAGGVVGDSWDDFEKRFQEGPRKPSRKQELQRFRSKLKRRPRPRPSGASATGDQVERLRSRYSGADGSLVRKQEGERTTFYWFPRRQAPPEDVAALGQLRGHLHPGLFLTKFRKTFLKDEMTHDLELVPIPEGDEAEYLRILPQSPP